MRLSFVFVHNKLPEDLEPYGNPGKRWRQKEVLTINEQSRDPVVHTVAMGASLQIPANMPCRAHAL